MTIKDDKDFAAAKAIATSVFDSSLNESLLFVQSGTDASVCI